METSSVENSPPPPSLNLIKLDGFIFDTKVSILLFDCQQGSWAIVHMEYFKGLPLIKIPSINALNKNLSL